MLTPWKKSYDRSRQHIKKQKHYFVNKGLYSQSFGFSSSHVWMWELDHKEGWVPKNWCFWTTLEKTLESPLDWKEIKSVNPKVNQSWIFTGRTDDEAEALALCPPDVYNWFIRKDPDTRKDWRQEKKVRTEDEMVGWHHWLNGHEFWQAPGDGKDRESWRAAVHEVTKCWIELSDWTATTTVCTRFHMRHWTLERSRLLWTYTSEAWNLPLTDNKYANQWINKWLQIKIYVMKGMNMMK